MKVMRAFLNTSSYLSKSKQYMDITYRVRLGREMCVETVVWEPVCKFILTPQMFSVIVWVRKTLQSKLIDERVKYIANQDNGHAKDKHDKKL